MFNIRPAPPLLFGFYFRRLLTESNRIAATYRCDQEACEDEVRPCQPHATPGSSSCPDGGGDLALTLRRSVQELCVRCATQVTPRAFFFICETELRYALRSKARSVQSAISTRADMPRITPCTSWLRRPCPIPRLPLQKRGRSCMPLPSPSPLPPISLRYCQAAMCTKESKFKLSNSKLTRRTPLIFDIYAGRKASNYLLHIVAAHPVSYAMAKARAQLHATRVPVPSFHPYRCAATKLLCVRTLLRRNPNSN